MLSIYKFGWLWGILFYWLAFQTFHTWLKRLYNLEMMSGCDEMFFQNDHRNNLNIVAFEKFEKFDAYKFRDLIVKRARIFPRIKSKIVNFLGKPMFFEMSDDDLVAEVETLC